MSRFSRLGQSRSARRARASRLRSARLEGLEARLVLSAEWSFAPEALSGIVGPLAAGETESGPLLAQVEWQGAERTVLAGQWVARFDWQGGTLGDQVQTLRQLTAGSSLPLAVDRHLGADGLFLLTAPPQASAEQVSTALGALPGFRYLEPNFALRADSLLPNDPSFGSQWALNNTGQSGGVADADIDAPEAWSLTTGSSGVVVGVIDTGVDYTHPDLAANMWHNPGETPGDGLDNDLNGYIDDIYGWDFANNDNDPIDDAGHGTAVSGIIAAVGNNGTGGTGINWGAQIMALKYLNVVEIGATADATAAVNYATMMRTRYGVNVRATNNSYGIAGYSQAMRDAIAAAGDAEILFVASAGNTSSNNDVGVVYPANFDPLNVLSVAATTRTDALASFSSYGPTSVHLGAPGAEIFTTRLGGGYRSSFNGTSAAAPMVAGVAALAWSANPYASLEVVRDAILSGTDPLPALAGITISGGRLNALGTLTALGFYVQAATPDAGEIVSTPPTTFTFDLSAPVAPGSLAAGALVVGGIPADQVSLLDADTVQFTFLSSPVLTEGLITYQLLGGVLLRDGDSAGLASFSEQFRYAAAPLQVVAISPAVESGAELPVSEILLTFNQPVDPATVDQTDLGLSEGQVVGAELAAANQVRFFVSDVSHQGPLQLFLPAGQLATSAGTPSEALAVTLEIDVATSPLAAFERVEPLGSLIYVARQDGLLQAGDDVDQFTFPLSAPDAVSVRLVPTDPDAVLALALVGVGSPAVSPGPGQAAVLSAAQLAAGSYTIAVSGDRATEYRLEVWRGAELEAEDTSPAMPLAMDASRTSLGKVTRLAVVGSFAPATISENFDDGSLDGSWQTYSSTAQGRIQLIASPSTAEASARAMIMDTSTSSTFTLNEAIWTIDVSGSETARLEFYHADFGDEETSLGGVFTEHRNGDGIAISGDGNTWHPIWNAPNQASGVWQFYSLDLGQAIELAGLDWGPGLRIKFQQYDDFSVPTDGRGYDQIAVRLSDVDAYTLDLTDHVGKPIDVVLAAREGAEPGPARVELWDPSGATLLAASDLVPYGASATNFAAAIQGYVAAAPGHYQIHVRSGASFPYTLLVTVDTTFDSEANDSSEDPLRSLDQSRAALGHLGLPPVLGSYLLTIDPAQSVLNLVGQVSDSEQTTSIPLSAQAPGSLTAALAGSLLVQVSEQAVTVVSGTLDPMASPGPYTPFGTSADFAAQIPLIGPLNAFAAMRNLGFSLFSQALPLDADGYFSAQGVGYKFVTGGIDYEIVGEIGSLPVATPDRGNDPDAPGHWEELPGQLRLTIPFHVDYEVTEPITGLLVQFEFIGQVVAWVSQPVLEPDQATLTLTAGQQVKLVTRTPGDGPGESPAETLDPRIDVFNPAGEPLAGDDNGAADGRNAALVFVAPADGVYRIAVSAVSGYGDYTLEVQDVPELIGDANGDCVVGAADYAIWAAQFGQMAAGLAADFDGDGSVGAGDYALWAANFGKTCAAPEPPEALAAETLLSIPSEQATAPALPDWLNDYLDRRATNSTDKIVVTTTPGTTITVADDRPLAISRSEFPTRQVEQSRQLRAAAIDRLLARGDLL